MQHTIVWPEGLNPKEYPVFAHNELFINAPAQAIWDILVNAKAWPEWYKNSKKVSLKQGGNTLQNGTEFEWTTFHFNVKSKVLVYNPPFDLGWDAKEFAAKGFHGWKLVPQQGGTLVVTQEVQTGFGARLLKPFIVKGLTYWHQKWLEGLIELSKIN